MSMKKYAIDAVAARKAKIIVRASTEEEARQKTQGKIDVLMENLPKKNDSSYWTYRYECYGVI